MNQLTLPMKIKTPPRRFPQEPILRSASIEDCYRWTMTRGWGTGPTIIWVLLNPSVADGKKDDPTTLRMIGFSYRWGFGSMVVVNVYPLISSTTDNLRAWRKTFNSEAWEGVSYPADKSSWSALAHNNSLISKLLEPDTVCVAAWGVGVPPRDLDYFLRGIRFTVEDEEFGTVRITPEWKCLGKTADGSPIHPLARGRNRVPDNATLKRWKRGGDT